MNRLILLTLLRMVTADLLWGAKNDADTNIDPYDYGVDVTTPIHHYLKGNGFFKKRYDELMAGCYKAYSKRECDATERARLEMSMEQPAAHYNYTKLGFKKMKVPDEVYKKIKAFWEENKVKGLLKENWPRGNTYVNNWEVPSYMVSLENNNLRGGWDLKNQIWDGVKPILSEWIGGKEIEPTSMYGIRVYKRGAYLATHADRLPLVTSCIIQVDQNVDEPWPLEIYSHDGKAYNVTLQPGEMALYESHTTLHGRPAPLKGEYFANIFVHFKPVEYDEILEKLNIQKAQHLPLYNKKKGGHEQDQHDDVTLERHMRDIDRENEKDLSVEDGRTPLHEAAAHGNIAEVENLLNNAQTEMLHSADANGWQPIHEAVRSGSIDVVKYMVSMGADIGAKTNNGASVLWWAKNVLPEGHVIIKYLENLNAPVHSPQ